MICDLVKTFRKQLVIAAELRRLIEIPRRDLIPSATIFRLDAAIDDLADQAAGGVIGLRP